MVLVSRNNKSPLKAKQQRLTLPQKVGHDRKKMRRLLLRAMLKKDAPLVFMIIIILATLYFCYRNQPYSLDLTDNTFPIVTSEDYIRIPKRIWFTYKHDLLVKKKPLIYYNNVLKTIHKYRSEWNDENAEAFVLDDEACIKILDKINPRLTEIFDTEPVGAYKGDICRMGALYLYGGYYFDVDMEVVSPFILPSNILFSTSWDATFGHMFNSYMAATPKHPILETYVNVTIEFYDENKASDYCKIEYELRILGPCLLHRSYALYLIGLGEPMDKDIYLLQENPSETNDLNNCGFEVNDPANGKRYFFSRIPGSSGCMNIPKKLWFIYDRDVLTTKEPKDVYEQMMMIHDAYKDIWDEHIPMEVLYDEKCLHILRQTDPYLKRAYVGETNKAFKEEYCRIAALYMEGGYSFDLNIDFVAPIVFSTDVTFSTSSTPEGHLTTTFMTSTKFHPVIDGYIESARNYFKNTPSNFCLDFENKEKRGSCLLTEGERIAAKEKRGRVYNILEREIKDNLEDYSFELVDPNTEKIYIKVKRTII